MAESVVLPEIEDHEHGAVSAAGTPESGLPHGHFAYVTQPTVAAERQGMGWLLAVILVAIALLVAAMLYWRATFRPAVLGPLDVTKQYLSALAIGDTGTQDQLATTVSKRQRLPAWLGVMRSAVNPALHQQGDNAFVKVRLYLTPRAGVAKLDARVREAASRPYDIELRLQRDGADWRIDQQALFTSLRAKIVHENPQIPLPTD